MHSLLARENIILRTAQINIIGTQNQEVTTRALCDNGTQVNLIITNSIVQQLKEKPIGNKTSFIGWEGIIWEHPPEKSN